MSVVYHPQMRRFAIGSARLVRQQNVDALRSGVVTVAYEFLYGFVRATVKPFGKEVDDVVVDA